METARGYARAAASRNTNRAYATERRHYLHRAPDRSPTSNTTRDSAFVNQKTLARLGKSADQGKGACEPPFALEPPMNKIVEAQRLSLNTLDSSAGARTHGTAFASSFECLSPDSG